MNAYQQGVSAVLGIPANVGTPDQLFFPSNFREREPAEYVRAVLTTQQIAELLHVDRSTVCVWRQKGWLKGRHGAKRQPNGLKFWYWRHSLKQVEDCLLVMQTRKRWNNPVEHTTWTPQEIETLLHGETPEGRSPIACRVKRCRVRKALHE